MRRGLLLVPLLLALPVGAHEGPHDCSERDLSALNHVHLLEVELAPGQNLTRTLAFDGCPLAADWWLLFWLDAPRDVVLDIDAEGEHLGTMRSMGQVAVHRLEMPVTGYPELTLRNDGNATAAARLYFDQTCDCSAKAVPTNGPVFLNVDADFQDKVTFDLRVLPYWPLLGNEPDPPARIEVRLTPMVDLGSALHTVDDAAKTLSFDPFDHAGCDPELEREGCRSISWEVTIPGRQVLWVEVLAGAEDGWSVMVLPAYEVRETPLPGWLAPGALLLVAAARQTLSSPGRRRD